MAEHIDARDERVLAYRQNEAFNRAAAQITVPTNDDDVRRELRERGAVVEIPMESKADRRGRLTQLLVKRSREESEEEEKNEEEEEEEEVIVPAYETTGPQELLMAREALAERVAKARESPKKEPKLDYLNTMNVQASQSGFARAVAAVKFISNETLLVGDWSGSLSAMQLDDEMTVSVSENLHSASISGLSVSGDLAVTSGMNPEILITRFTDKFTAVGKLIGHTARVPKVDTTPDSVVSASLDGTWKWWDLHTQQLRLTQDNGPTYTAKVSSDVALVATGSTDGTVRVWDLRSGVMVLTSKAIKEVYALAWDGEMRFASGGADNQITIWDLRKAQEPERRIYAHTNTVSDLQFSGTQLISASYDGTVKVWGTDTVHKVQVGSRIMSFDISKHGLVAGRWDRQVDWLYSA